MIDRIISLLIISLLTACSPPQSRTFHAFGTKITVEIDGQPYQKTQAIYQEIEKRLQDMHTRWHAWENSELSEIREACQTGQAIQINEDLAYLIERGQDLETQSMGYFNPAIGELIDLWGFLSHTPTQERSAPDHQVIEAALSHRSSMQDLQLNGLDLTCKNPHLRLDLGAYAKGYGVEKIVLYLKEQGVERALVNAGGDLMILQDQTMPERRVGILSLDKATPELVLHLKESTAVFTSGTYARNFRELSTQKKFHHLINPKTGYPSTDFASVTVVHPDPVLADAAATALLASDKASWLQIVNNMGIEKYLLITSNGERMGTLVPPQ